MNREPWTVTTVGSLRSRAVSSRRSVRTRSNPFDVCTCTAVGSAARANGKAAHGGDQAHDLACA